MKNKWDWWSVESRRLLAEFDIDGSYTKDALAKANKEDIHNLALAVNGAEGIHGENYARAVWKNLSDIIAQGGGRERIRARLVEALAEMKKTLEKGGTFW